MQANESKRAGPAPVKLGAGAKIQQLFKPFKITHRFKSISKNMFKEMFERLQTFEKCLKGYKPLAIPLNKPKGLKIL